MKSQYFNLYAHSKQTTDTFMYYIFDGFFSYLSDFPRYLFYNKNHYEH